MRGSGEPWSIFIYHQYQHCSNWVKVDCLSNMKQLQLHHLLQGFGSTPFIFITCSIIGLKWLLELADFWFGLFVCLLFPFYFEVSNLLRLFVVCLQSYLVFLFSSLSSPCASAQVFCALWMFLGLEFLLACGPPRESVALFISITLSSLHLCRVFAFWIHESLKSYQTIALALHKRAICSHPIIIHCPAVALYLKYR